MPCYISSGNRNSKGQEAVASKATTKAVAYFRTSSATNVGADKDSLKHQRQAVEAFGRRAGYEAREGRARDEQGHDLQRGGNRPDDRRSAQRRAHNRAHSPR